MKRAFSLLLAFAAVLALSAQNFERGALYHLVSASTGKALTLRDGRLVLAAPDADEAGQLFNAGELSGSLRFINPFAGLAVRAEGDALASGEVNGSDEAQLWQCEPMPDGRFLLVPTNRPALAASVASDGRLVLVDKAGARASKAARFEARRSPRAGFSDESVYRIRACASGQVLGNGDSGENNARIRLEAQEADNRGQYWSIKMIDLDRRAVENAFYGQHFDDGGDNASIRHLLQWPATAGVWRNAQFVFEPVDGGRAYLLCSAGKPGTMYRPEGGQLNLVKKNSGDTGAWFRFEAAEKPKIASPYWEDETMFAEHKEPGIANPSPKIN